MNSWAKPRRWWPFVLLIVAGASRWLLVAARPEAASTLGSEALGCTWAALLLGTLGQGRGRHVSIAGRGSWRWPVAGALLVGGPLVGLLIRGRDLDGGALTIALALTPVVVAIASAALGAGSGDGIAGRIWPGLAAVAGLLLVLAQPELGDVRTDVALVLAPLFTGLGASLFLAEGRAGIEPEGLASTEQMTWGLAGAAVVFALGLGEARFVERLTGRLSLTAVACDGLLALLSVLALGRLGELRWSAQFTLLPLLILLEGIALARPPVTARWGTGLALLAVASVYLLLPETPAGEGAA